MSDSVKDMLVLDQDHPGRFDEAYVARREAMWRLCREHREGELGIPRLAYVDEDHAVWSFILDHLAPIHRRRACTLYLEGLRRLRLSRDRMPQLADLDTMTRAAAGLTLVPAEGMLGSLDFFRYLAAGRMPCTQYLRHASRPEYTPEPDAVHDILGHVPLLMDPSYASLVRLTGAGALAAQGKDLEAFERLYWFGIEFGLIEEEGDVKIFGAGLLSSYGEMESALSEDVERRPFVLEEVIAMPYDPTQLQPILFVLPSLAALREATERLIEKRLGGAVLRELTQLASDARCS